MRSHLIAVAIATNAAGGCVVTSEQKPFANFGGAVRHCRVVVDGLAIADGTCEIFGARDGTSFQIRDIVRRDERNSYFVVVHLDPSGAARGVWNGLDRTLIAREELGPLTRAGPCYSNEKASICAWD
jgi:hypothetical protein